MVSALEPEWEAGFEPRSYGFRPGRGCHDAIHAIYRVVEGRRPKRPWAPGADLARAFDKLAHDHILHTLGAFPARGSGGRGRARSSGAPRIAPRTVFLGAARSARRC